MIAIIDYAMGNSGSILNMLRKLGHVATISADEHIITHAEKLILPGVGAFDHGMMMLRRNGLDDILRRQVVENHVPILGICLGMQLFARHSEEGSETGLGWIDADVVRFGKGMPKFNLKVPHMGWNEIQVKEASPIFSSLNDKARFYFVHSYHMNCADESDVSATANYGYEFTASVHRGNIYGTQFHPEKSHKFGLALLKSFVENL